MYIYTTHITTGRLTKLCLLLISLIPDEQDTIQTWTNEGFDDLCKAIVTLTSCYDKHRSLWKDDNEKILQLFEHVTKRIYRDFSLRMLDLAKFEILQSFDEKETMNTDFNNDDFPKPLVLEDATMGPQSQFYDTLHVHDRLTMLGNLGRTSAQCSILFLYEESIKRVRQIMDFYHGQSTEQINDVKMAVIHEQLWWLFQMLGYLLADDCDGETPTIPIMLLNVNKNMFSQTEGAFNDEHDNSMASDETMSSSTSSLSSSQDPLFTAIQPLFMWAKFENQCIAQRKKDPFLSPHLGLVFFFFFYAIQHNTTHNA
ncbi:hypothetical protein RFI_12162 [Reticulomyxa filosa]|uniref:Uncharacterized protein n=1 Tax=Reticulomyxa filosa TaxID=46433 RepID=X6NG78_RETFI|nr:hypothetical protein RFI_12162 [Reticulomyxa filosa]|eukprot:ETO24981.1 hypothetical protein RFI_12162 [Reticulomyxa filosa]